MWTGCTVYTVPISVTRTSRLHVLLEGGRALADLTPAAIQVEMPGWPGASNHLGATVFFSLEKKKKEKRKKMVRRGQTGYPAL